MEPQTGKRVSWVELYLDLVFVLAVAQLAHLIVAEPEMRSVWIALGLFATLWWTWVGFAVLYNRHGVEELAPRLLFLAGSIPAGVAAVAIDGAATGDSTVFALSLATTRLVLAAAEVVTGEGAGALRRRITLALLASALLFAVSIWVPGPLRYVLWAVAIGVESNAMLAEDREATERARRERDWSALRPADPREALDAHHFAERFGLFLIILLGEVVVEAGQGSAEHVDSFGGWAALVAAMLLAGALWWLYFDSSAEINLRVLELSGGSPTMARAIFAVGHMVPAFALLITAAGVGLLLEEEPPAIAYWLGCVGLGMYLASTRASFGGRRRRGHVLRVLGIVVTFQLARLDLEPRPYLWLLAGVAVLWALVNTRRSDYEEDTSSSIASTESGAPQSSSEAGAGRL
jgi:low temperature requirement protein LtrA